MHAAIILHESIHLNGRRNTLNSNSPLEYPEGINSPRLSDAMGIK